MIDHQLPWTIIRCAARFVPAARRAEWLTEWDSEIWYALRSRSRGRVEVLRFTLGAFNDAFWIWSNSANLSSDLWLRSPRSCLASLLAVAAICVLSFVYSPGSNAVVALGQNDRIVLWMVFPAVCALLILPAVTILDLGRTFEVTHSPAHKVRWRLRVFTIMKFALVLVIAFFGALEFAPPSTEPHAMLLACVLGFRWVLLDHQLRCPVCLRRLVAPVRIGSASHTFLGHYATELRCDKGHGVMCTPDAVTNYTAQRWSDSALYGRDTVPATEQN